MRVADDMAGRRARHELRTDVGLSSMESSGALARHRIAESRSWDQLSTEGADTGC
jgi:hypothetical protein